MESDISKRSVNIQSHYIGNNVNKLKMLTRRSRRVAHASEPPLEREDSLSDFQQHARVASGEDLYASRPIGIYTEV